MFLILNTLLFFIIKRFELFLINFRLKICLAFYLFFDFDFVNIINKIIFKSLQIRSYFLDLSHFLLFLPEFILGIFSFFFLIIIILYRQQSFNILKIKITNFIFILLLIFLNLIGFLFLIFFFNNSL